MRKPAASRNLTEHQDIPEDGIPARTILGTDDMKVMLFTVSADQELPERTASMPAVVHFIRGNAKAKSGRRHPRGTAGNLDLRAAQVETRHSRR